MESRHCGTDTDLLGVLQRVVIGVDAVALQGQDLAIRVVDDQAMHVESVCVAGHPARFEFGIEANMRGRQQTKTGEAVTFGSKNFAHKYPL